MTRSLLLALSLIVCLQNISFAQGAEFFANVFWQNTSNRVVIRLALKNPTGSSSGQMKFVGMRFGFQYNSSRVAFAGYTSYMTGLNDPNPNYLNFIGPDTAPNAEVNDAPSTRTAFVLWGGASKLMQRRYINRSTDICSNAMLINAGETLVLLDLYFTLNPGVTPEFYHLTDPDYGFGDFEFIAQLLDKWSSPNNDPHNAYLLNDHKDIAIIVNRIANTQEPYQPFDASGCVNNNFNPITIGRDDAYFITPINGVLAAKINSASIKRDLGNAVIDWSVDNNNLVDHFEIEQVDQNGSFKTKAIILGGDIAFSKDYSFKDKITGSETELRYRIKTFSRDGIISFSNILKLELKQIEETEIRFVPNPVIISAQLNLPAISGNYICRVYNMDGRIIMTSQLQGRNQLINVQQLKTGSYFVEAFHPQTGKRYYGKFTKQ